MVSNWKIKERTILSIMELSKSAMPNEFSGLLVGDPDSRVINDIYIIPATVNGPASSTIRQDLVPLSFSIVGSVHSHPQQSSLPSSADMRFFQSKYINIISHFPFNKYDFSAYDSKGQRVALEIIP